MARDGQVAINSEQGEAKWKQEEESRARLEQEMQAKREQDAQSVWGTC